MPYTKPEPHPTHKMTEWRRENRGSGSTPRLYGVRECEFCGKEELELMGGHFLYALKKRCPNAPKEKLLDMSQMDAETVGKKFKLPCDQCKKSYIQVTLVNAGMGYFKHRKYGAIDLRNQSYVCSKCRGPIVNKSNEII